MMHESPDGKIGLYTRFFDFANFCLPLSTFLVDVLRYFRINLSQLSVITAAKVSHFEILCRVLRIEPTVRLFHYSLKHWNDHFFWVDSFACPDSFPWHASKSVSKDPPPKPTEFNADHYAALVAHPTSYHHDDDEEMDLSAFIRALDPTKVKVVEKERINKEEPKLSRLTMAAWVPLIPFPQPPTPPPQPPLHYQVGVAAVATLPLVTSSVSATPEHKDGNPVESITRANLHTIGPSKRFVISSDSSHHSSTNVAEAEVDSVIRYAAPFPVMTEAVITASAASALFVLKTAVQATPQFQPSIFHDSSSSGTIKPDASGSSHHPGKEF
ncbi:hypothetical protein Tco_1555253 [Tanacetum coccineum]